MTPRTPEAEALERLEAGLRSLARRSQPPLFVVDLSKELVIDFADQLRDIRAALSSPAPWCPRCNETVRTGLFCVTCGDPIPGSEGRAASEGERVEGLLDDMARAPAASTRDAYVWGFMDGRGDGDLVAAEAAWEANKPHLTGDPSVVRLGPIHGRQQRR